jgi:hypothetical protein
MKCINCGKEIKDSDTRYVTDVCPFVYCEECADMELEPSDAYEDSYYEAAVLPCERSYFTRVEGRSHV